MRRPSRAALGTTLRRARHSQNCTQPRAARAGQTTTAGATPLRALPRDSAAFTACAATALEPPSRHCAYMSARQLHRAPIRSALVGCVTSHGLLARCYRSLEWNQLTGAIPDSLGSLSSLQFLCAPVRWLSRMQGARPMACVMPAASPFACSVRHWRTAIGDPVRAFLTHHRARACWHRVLYNNQLTGAIPDSLGSLANLIFLCVLMRWLCAQPGMRKRRKACQLRAAAMLGCLLRPAALICGWLLTHRPRAHAHVMRVRAQEPRVESAHGRDPNLARLAV